MRIVSEPEFREVFTSKLMERDLLHVGSVTGPGRSGAIAAVYASHILGVPYIPPGGVVPRPLGALLIVDTARASGRTIRKMQREFGEHFTEVIVAFEEPPRVAFWYEAAKPLRYRHEGVAA